jgi:hypothetical protein
MGRKSYLIEAKFYLIPKFSPKKWRGMRVSGREGREEEGQSRAKRGMEETVRGKEKGNGV